MSDFSEQIEYLNTLIDSDVHTSADEKKQLHFLVSKLDTPISREEKFQIMLLLVTLLFDYINKGGPT